MTILILHGIGGYAGIHWQQWLHDKLVEKGHKVIMPNLPDSDHPDRKTWLNKVQKIVKEIKLTQLIIVGHSLGVPTALDLIETFNSPIKALISVSGFSNDYGAELNSYFLKEKKIYFKRVKKNCQKFFVIYGDDDPYVPQTTLHSLANKLGVKPKVIHKGGHLNTDTGFTRFPLLLNIFKEKN